MPNTKLAVTPVVPLEVIKASATKRGMVLKIDPHVIALKLIHTIGHHNVQFVRTFRPLHEERRPQE